MNPYMTGIANDNSTFMSLKPEAAALYPCALCSQPRYERNLFAHRRHGEELNQSTISKYQSYTQKYLVFTVSYISVLSCKPASFPFSMSSALGCDQSPMRASKWIPFRPLRWRECEC